VFYHTWLSGSIAYAAGRWLAILDQRATLLAQEFGAYVTHEDGRNQNSLRDASE